MEMSEIWFVFSVQELTTITSLPQWMQSFGEENFLQPTHPTNRSFHKEHYKPSLNIRVMWLHLQAWMYAMHPIMMEPRQLRKQLIWHLLTSEGKGTRLFCHLR